MPASLRACLSVPSLKPRLDELRVERPGGEAEEEREKRLADLKEAEEKAKVRWQE